MVKHLVDIDDDTLAAARAELGTATIKTLSPGARRATGAAQRKPSKTRRCSRRPA